LYSSLSLFVIALLCIANVIWQCIEWYGKVSTGFYTVHNKQAAPYNYMAVPLDGLEFSIPVTHQLANHQHPLFLYCL
jgi:hypothetical protein